KDHPDQQQRESVGGNFRPAEVDHPRGAAQQENRRDEKSADPRQRRFGEARHHARKVPPWRLATSATTFAASASISCSVMVLSRGWIVTAMATDFLPASMPWPS